MKFSYYSKTHNSPEDAVVFLDNDVGVIYDNEDLAELGEMAAEYAWKHNDGYEWVDGTDLVILCDGEKLGVVNIEVESEPIFVGSVVK